MRWLQCVSAATSWSWRSSTMMRVGCTMSTLLLSVSGGSSAPHSPNHRPQRPCVLLLISDDLRPQLDAAGYSTDGAPVTTPRLKQLASESVVFTRAYVQEALCAPSRNSFLSGRRPDTTRAWQFRDSFREAAAAGGGEGWTALPQLFLEAGWTTVGAGKVYHPHLPPNWDLNYSWDPRMSDGTWAGWMYPSEPRCPEGTVGCGIDDSSGDPSLFEDAQTTQVALEQLRNVSTQMDDDGTPFFVAAGFRKPHVQWRVPKRILDSYPPVDSIPLPATPDYPPTAPAIAFHQPVDDFLQAFTDVQACGGVGACSPLSHFNDTCVRTWRRQYWASVSYMDEQVGILLDELDKLGKRNDTIVTFFGDHGWQLGEFSEWEKFTNFELAARVPLMFRVPWSSAALVHSIVELVDVMPTLAELAGLRMPAHEPVPLDGASLVPLMVHASEGAGDGSTEAVGPAKQQLALTQFPRCLKVWGHGVPRNQSLPDWAFNDCDDVPREQFTHMGLSIRTERWRFTRWYLWNGTALRPDWEDASGFAKINTELYDHDGDDGSHFGGQHEATNLAANSGMAPTVQKMALQLEHAFGRIQ